MHCGVHEALAAVWRIESARIVGALMRLTRDLGAAEELAQDALVAALEHWPRDGVPDRPGAWLTTVAKRRALDRLRHRGISEARHDELGQDLVAMQADVVPDFVDALDAARGDDIGDDLLRLMFTACHPLLPTESRVALTLRLLGGLTTHEIARAYLLPEATIAQRIARAKKRLADARVPFEVPRGEALQERLASVLEVVYLIFNEGYTATAGGDWMRPALGDEALRLARMLAELAPNDSEVHALQALLELQASRTKARTDAAGHPVLLADQDRRRWDRLLIRRGLAALARAEASGAPPGPYRLQAEVAACHARAADAASTDWTRIAALYGELVAIAPSPVVELNRAVAVAMAQGPAAGLAIVDRLCADAALANYHWLPSVRGELLQRLGRRDEAHAEFERAATMAGNARERELLLKRAAALAAAGRGADRGGSP
ncbi:MAG: RNA polymerase sigma factor [Gammaproteobacteria bacterium]|uniref:RNA polymerase sigma factor n=1 Tax=Azohydromonas sp. TaxID=1872666 RepID=UPI002D1E1CA2|nr:RNA polymerase sigma factor [Azohydromonas sp.]HMM84926.1 RNA polymerase sigma factor [Azohydromonas sp.]